MECRCIQRIYLRVPNVDYTVVCGHHNGAIAECNVYWARELLEDDEIVSVIAHVM